MAAGKDISASDLLLGVKSLSFENSSRELEKITKDLLSTPSFLKYNRVPVVIEEVCEEVRLGNVVKSLVGNYLKISDRKGFDQNGRMIAYFDERTTAAGIRQLMEKGRELGFNVYIGKPERTYFI